MNEAEYYEAVKALPKTAAGLEEKIRLLQQVVWDEETEPVKENGDEHVQYHKRETRVENYYYGVSPEYLNLWVALRESGIILGRAWICGRGGCCVSVCSITQGEPISCKPVPNEYSGRRGDGLW